MRDSNLLLFTKEDNRHFLLYYDLQSLAGPELIENFTKKIPCFKCPTISKFNDYCVILILNII